ncbi:hypothetical protein ACP70R_037516 [Stipagrostis hirtigluma subsp. patula]
MHHLGFSGAPTASPPGRSLYSTISTTKLPPEGHSPASVTVCRTLGFLEKGAPMTADVSGKYTEFFATPMTRTHVAALAKLVVLRDAVRKVVDDSKPILVCIQETKLAVISDWDVCSLLGRDFQDYVYLAAQGTRGGVLVAWRQGFLTSDQHLVHRHSVSVRFSLDDEPAWWFTGVYGPHQDADKAGFLDELREVREHCQGP